MRRVLAALVVAAFACGCAQQSSPTRFLSASPNAHLESARGYLYVVNSPGTSGSLSVYASGGTAPIATITDGIHHPSGVAVDRGGNVYVSNNQPSSVSVYAPGAGTPALVLTPGGAVAVDGSGNVAVSSGDAVREYAAGSNVPFRTLVEGSFYQEWNAAFDSLGNLYVAVVRENLGFHARIDVFPPSGTTVIRSIPISDPRILDFDNADNFYVADVLGGTHAPPTYQVLVFAAGTAKQTRSVPRRAISCCSTISAMTLSPTSELCLAVANKQTTGSVRCYAPGTNAVRRTIAAGIDRPVAMAVGSGGRLYVANRDTKTATTSITVYAPGAVLPSRKITQGITYPVAIAVSP